MILDLFKLDGKVAMVTGASRGLGQAMAVGLAEAGADIVGVGKSGNFTNTQRTIERLGRRFLPVTVDLAETGATEEVMSSALRSFGHIDILVNAAAAQRRRQALDFTEEDWNHLLSVNLKAAYFLCRAAAREMARQKRGKIINITSLLAFQGGLGVLAYTATKGGLSQLTKALSNELAPSGINVNAIAPGYYATEMNEALLNDPVRLPQINARIPAARWGKPEDLKGAAVYLASAASDYVHGQTLIVDGGWMAR